MNNFRRSITYLIWLVAIFSGLTLPAQAQIVSNLKIKVKAGLDGLFKSGCYNNIYLDITNPSGGNRYKGSAEVKIDKSGTFKVAIDVPSPGHKLYVLPIFYPFDYPNGQTLIIKNALGVPINRIKIDVREVVRKQDKVVVVVNPNQAGLGAVNKHSFTFPTLKPMTGFGVELGIDIENTSFNPYQPVISLTREETISQVIVRYLKLEELPTSFVEYDAIDVLVLHDGDYNLFTSDNYQALDAWVRTGKLLVMVTGDRVGRIATSRVAPLLPRTYSGTTVISGAPQGLVSYTGVKLNASSNLVVAQGQLKSDAEIVAGTNDLPLIVRKKHGFGEVVEIAFDYLSPPVSNYPVSFEPAFWSGIWGANLAKTSLDDIAVPGNKIISFQASSEQKSGEGIIRLVGIFLLAYIIILGPFNFFSLARLKKHTLLWITIPLTIATFTAGGILTGNIVQGSNNRITTLNQIFITDKGSNVSSFTNYLVGLNSLFSAGNNKVIQKPLNPNVVIYNRVLPYESKLLNIYAKNTNDYFDGFDDVITNENGTIVSQRIQPRWSFEFDRFLGISQNNWSFELNQAKFEPNQPKGSLILKLPDDLYKAYLLMGSTERFLGIIEANQNLNISEIMDSDNAKELFYFKNWIHNAYSSFRDRLIRLASNDLWLTGIIKSPPQDINVNLRTEREDYTLVAFNLGPMDKLRDDLLPRIKAVSIIRESENKKNKPKIDLRNYGYQLDEFYQIRRPEFNSNEIAQFDIYFSKTVPGYLKIECIEKRDNNIFQERPDIKPFARTYAGIESIQALNRSTGVYDNLKYPVFLGKEYFGPDHLVRLKIKFNNNTKVESIRMSNIK